MNEDLDNIQYSPIWNYNYSQWFHDVQHNDKTLSEAERKAFVVMMDETIEVHSEGLPLMYESLESDKDKHDEYHVLERTVSSIWLFVLITMIDCLVACKYFITADKDYDRRFMRGKLMVILNEGFKKLYGFDDKTHKKSEWKRFLSVMKFFPEEIKNQYQEITSLLKKQAQSSLWWQEERNLETHIDAERLYESRKEEIIESKVMIDSMKLYETLLAVSHFLGNVHACVHNFLVTKYRNGELID